MGNIYYNGLLYLVLTSILLLIWINEKKLGNLIREKRSKFSDYLIEKWNIKNDLMEKIIRKSVDWIETLGSAIFLVLLIQHFYLGNFLVPTGSMIPTINPKDRLFGDMISYKFVKPKRGDILVFIEPIQNKVRYTKRLIGMPGEKVRISTDSKVYIDGKQLTGEKFNRDYYQMMTSSAIKDSEWAIPKKGDRVKLVNAKIRLGKKMVSYKQLTKGLADGTIDLMNLGIKSMKFKINGREYKDGLFSYVVDLSLREKLLRGEKIQLNGKTIEISGGKYIIYPDPMNIEELKKLLETDEKAFDNEIEIETMETLVNGKDESGPILDREVLKELIRGKELTLTHDYYFVMGDNSKNSLDSRYWGFVKDQRIKGRPFLRFWPLPRFALLK